MKKWLIAAGIVVVLVMLLVSGYNNLVKMSESVDGSWAQVENQLQRRLDLIPNLVETVKGYAAQEQEVFGQVSDARAKLAGTVQGNATASETAQADQALTSAVGRLLAIAENYPQLKSDANFRALQDELAGTENRIATVRMDYNNAVQAYNAKIKTFPTLIYANIFGFDERDYFKADEGAANVPNVDFSK
ncbi:LemA family protein [Syntrophobotulus glycolicus DSM 8271]|uniref:LemA family protein n=1 Tax=Syntrophobotulus glycolicus (strain DSM 8271 / FlGlyR) TaxID=645991 RepID=F0SXQ5_SYNGF|nr:LemA family protein [Syntrophobotulus glycolicus]ADY55888.1 LemA family protein [Syntrophobotulus glycolicus DSM 8271]